MSKKRSVEEINTDLPKKCAEPTMFNLTPPDVGSDRTTDETKKGRPTQAKADHRTSLRKLVYLNNTLSDEKKKVVESMGFGSLLELNIRVLDNAMMAYLIKKFDSSSCVLELCGKSIHITLDKVKSALGIPCTDKELTNIEGSDNGWSRYKILFLGSGGHVLDLAALESKLTKCESSGADFKVMYMLFLCATVLLPKYGASLDFGILDYLVDLNNIHTYNWAGIVLKRLVDGVENHRRKNTTKVTGCIFLLQVIFVTELASMYPRHGKYIMPTKAYVEQWTQEEVNHILRMFAKGIESTRCKAEIDDNEYKLNQPPLSEEATFTSEGISLLKFIAEQVQLLNGRINNLEKRFTSVESAVSRLLTNTCVKPKDNSESLRQETCRSVPNEGISTPAPQGKHKIGNEFDSFHTFSPDTAFTQEQQDLQKKSNCCSPSSLNPNIKQVKRKILSPRVLNFDTHELNGDGSEKTKENTDIFHLVCKEMGESTAFQFIFDQELPLSDMLVKFENAELTRKSIACLKPKEWLNDDVINCVAYVNWYNRKSCSFSSRHWNLPTWFSAFTRLKSFTDEQINKGVFGSKSILFRGLPSRCLSISIPIHDDDHWFLCKVDFTLKIIEICDTLRTSNYDKRLTLIEEVVMKLEDVSKLWPGEPFRHSKWHSTFKYRYSTTPQQPNGYDCGLYVCLLMMFPDEGVNRALTEEESVATRRKLASHLFSHSQNLVRPRDPISVWVTPLPNKTTCHRVPTEYNVNELTLGGILKEVYKVWAEDSSGDTMELKDDEDLQKLAESCLANYDPTICLELAWNLKEENMYMDPSHFPRD